MVNFNKLQSNPLQPKFIDYKTEIKETKTDNGIKVSYIDNERNDLFNMNVIFDMGSDNDKSLVLLQVIWNIWELINIQQKN